MKKDHVIIEKRWFSLIVHLLIWLVILSSPLLLIHNPDREFSWEAYSKFLSITSLLIVLFYVNYFFLIDRFVFKRHLWKYIIFNLFFIMLLIGSEYTYRLYSDNSCREESVAKEETLREDVKSFYLDLKERISENQPNLGVLLAKAILMSLVVGLSLAIKMTGKWYKDEIKLKDFERDMTQAELKNLKNQLNPHFFFNTLNNIYSLVSIDPAKAQEAIHSLSGLMRYVLYENNDNMIPLEKELAFIKRYVELMSLRLSPENAEVRLTIPEDVEGVEIAPLLFVNLIENAFKHGISGGSKAMIDILFSIELIGFKKSLICCVENSNYAKSDSDMSGSGVGLDNMKKRLDIIYPSRYSFTTYSDEKIYRANLVVELDNPSDLNNIKNETKNCNS